MAASLPIASFRRFPRARFCERLWLVALITGLGLCRDHAQADPSLTRPLPVSFEIIKGAGCSPYGDADMRTHARGEALALAQEHAVESHPIFTQSSTTIRQFQLEEDVVQTASASLLQNVRVDWEQTRQHEICVAVQGLISPALLDVLIRQRINAKEISQAAVVAAPAASSSEFKVWTNKPDGRYVEGERLVIYVQSLRDVYLKLDYFQADGSVVHLLPNQFRGPDIIQAGRVYAFGDESSPERFAVQSPFGTETITAIVSPLPFDGALHEKSQVGDGRNYLQMLASSRGEKVQGVSYAVPLQTQSGTVAEYRKTRTVSWRGK